MRCLALASFAALLCALPVVAEEKPADRGFTIGEGKIAFTAPEGWVKKEPRSRIVEAEFEVPAVKDDKAAGRLTAMGAGGSVESNVERWVGQFVADGEAVKPQTDKLTVDGAEVHIVSLQGTYKDSPGGPFAGGKTVLRENYRMLGAICKTESGNYFLKLYGPQATVDANEKAFRSLVESMKVK
ncbi:MAG: hypothetical protein WD872_08665 [Pirellulaceae bacterium]